MDLPRTGRFRVPKSHSSHSTCCSWPPQETPCRLLPFHLSVFAASASVRDAEAFFPLQVSGCWAQWAGGSSMFSSFTCTCVLDGVSEALVLDELSPSFDVSHFSFHGGNRLEPRDERSLSISLVEVSVTGGCGIVFLQLKSADSYRFIREWSSFVSDGR